MTLELITLILLLGVIIYVTKTNLIPEQQGGDCTQPYLNYSKMYTSEIPRSMYTDGKTQDANFSSQKTPAPYYPPCLTKKPYGNAMATYNYWKYLPNLLESQYLDCDKYHCANQINNGYTALPTDENKTQPFQSSVGQTLACDPVNPDYYNSPEDFCANHPEDYPCPNWWLKNPEQIRDVSRVCNSNQNKCYKPESIVIPSNSKYGFCLSTDPKCKLNDGQGILLIHRGREDHGLC